MFIEDKLIIELLIFDKQKYDVYYTFFDVIIIC